MSKVLIVDHIRIKRDSLASLICGFPIVSDVVATSVDDAGVGAGSEPRPDIILLGACCPSSQSILAQILTLAPSAKVIAVGICESEIVACLDAGYWGYILAEGTLEELEDVLHAATHDQPACTPLGAPVIRRAQGLTVTRANALGTPHLTPRENEILALLDLGLSNKQISRRLAIRVFTVKNHVHNILAKLGVGRRGEAVAQMRRLRYVSTRSLNLRENRWRTGWDQRAAFAKWNQAARVSEISGGNKFNSIERR